MQALLALMELGARGINGAQSQQTCSDFFITDKENKWRNAHLSRVINGSQQVIEYIWWRWWLLYHQLTAALPMAMAKESVAPPDLHGRNHTRRPTHVFPGGRTVALALAVMVTTVLFVLLLPTQHPATLYRSPMPTHISPLETKTGMHLLTSIFICSFIMQHCYKCCILSQISRVPEFQVRLLCPPKKITGSFFFPFWI